jgi:hypothetical protein
VPYYLYTNRVEISCSGNTEVSQCAPAPGGQGWRKGGDHYYKKRGFLQSRFFGEKFRDFPEKFSDFPRRIFKKFLENY